MRWLWHPRRRCVLWHFDELSEFARRGHGGFNATSASGQNEKTRNEHMSAGLPPIADIARRGWHGGKVPRSDIGPAIRSPRRPLFAERALWNIDSGSASLRLDVEGPDDVAPLLRFVGDELAKVGGRKR